MSNIQFIQVSPQELADLINEGLKSQVEDLIKELTEQQESGKEFLSRAETKEFFSISYVTLHAWCKLGLLHPLKMGNKTFFRRAQLVEALLNSNKGLK